MPRLAALALSALIGIAPHASAAEAPPEGFRSLLNGKVLAGWQGRPHFDPRAWKALSTKEQAEKSKQWTAEAREHWRMDGDELVNDGAGPYLTTDDVFGDYELLIDYKTVPTADSGVYLKGNPQVQIWDSTDPADIALGADHGSGGLWNNSKGARGRLPLVLADKPFGEWNHLRIRQVGARTSVWLNDKQVVDHAIMENYWDRESPLFRDGPIQLQTHGGEIRWRNVFVRELPIKEANAELAEHDDDGFETLFNGRDLEGWIGATDSYEVEDGAIRCKPGQGGMLLTSDEYGDFVARLEFRLPPAGNNGLAIRSPGSGDTAYEGMCELQVLDSEHPKYANIDPRQHHGSAYGMAPAHRGYLRPQGEWNFQEVTVQGSKVRVELNGNVILDTNLADATDFMDGTPHPGKDRTSGHFGFAGHGDPVEFRSVQIKRLTGEE